MAHRQRESNVLAGFMACTSKRDAVGGQGRGVDTPTGPGSKQLLRTFTPVGEKARAASWSPGWLWDPGTASQAGTGVA
jgi:hypothetical protein